MDPSLLLPVPPALPNHALLVVLLQDQILSLAEQRKSLHSENTTLSGEVSGACQGRIAAFDWHHPAGIVLRSRPEPHSICLLQVESLQKLLNIARREASSANASLDVAYVSVVGWKWSGGVGIILALCLSFVCLLSLPAFVACSAFAPDCLLPPHVPLQAQADEMKGVLGDLQAQARELKEARAAAEAQAEELRAAADELRAGLRATTAQVGG